jgi:hypothetical protein
MWELICHHSYKWNGMAVDLSPKGSHGVVHVPQSNFLQDGASAGSGAWRFNQPGNRVTIAPSAAWSQLSGIVVLLKIRFLPRPAGSQNGRMIFAVDGSFALVATSFDTYEDLHFSFYNPSGAEIPPESNFTSTVHDGVEGFELLPPVNTWIDLMLVNDGLGTLQMLINGKPITYLKVPPVAVPGCGPLGITIGNDTNGTSPAYADIDEIKIWRVDPQAFTDNFLNRPMDSKTRDCWIKFIEAIKKFERENPDCAARVFGRTSEGIENWEREKRRQSRDPAAQRIDIGKRYQSIWASGKLSSKEFLKVFQDEKTWLDSKGLGPDKIPEIANLTDDYCWQQLLATLKALDCDKELSEFFKSLNQEKPSKISKLKKRIR